MWCVCVFVWREEWFVATERNGTKMNRTEEEEWIQKYVCEVANFEKYSARPNNENETWTHSSFLVGFHRVLSNTFLCGECKVLFSSCFLFTESFNSKNLPFFSISKSNAKNSRWKRRLWIVNVSTITLGEENKSPLFLCGGSVSSISTCWMRRWGSKCARLPGVCGVFGPIRVRVAHHMMSCRLSIKMSEF